MNTPVHRTFAASFLVCAAVFGALAPARGARATVQAAALLQSAAALTDQDWPQTGRDAQRSNYSPVQVNAPYCYAWKWVEVPIAARAQPAVVGNLLFVGSMNGAIYARNATTGAPLWQYQTNGPIRDGVGVFDALVIASSHDGWTYALNAADGTLAWKAQTGPSATAPLIDAARGRTYVTSTDGFMTALTATTGAQIWAFDAGAAILTAPALSADGALVYLGNERVQAIAVDAITGQQRWRTQLQGQSLSDWYPVVAGASVYFRSQPLLYFHLLLEEGDDALDAAGPRDANWTTDWNKVRPQVINYLTAQPASQSFFALDAASGQSRGVAPVLYGYGNNDAPAPPVIRGSEVYLSYRPRHGIQTDGGAVHVTSRYDAELGRMNPSTLDITGLTQAANARYSSQFRMTSDEPTALTMGGNILWADNWERLGGIDVATGALLHVGNVSNIWPACYGGNACGPIGNNPFFPLRAGDTPYPFPGPRVTEGNQKPGVVIANNMLYWRVTEGGIAGVKSGSCGAPQIWPAANASAQRVSTVISASAARPSPTPASQSPAVISGSQETITGTRLMLPITMSRYSVMGRYVTEDMSLPASDPPQDLVLRLRREVSAMLTLAQGQHLLPYYFERGFSSPRVWPYTSSNCSGAGFCMALIHFGSHGNAVWHDPGELLLTMAQVYPYLDSAQQTQLRQYMSAEMQRYPPLERLPHGGAWLKQGVAREEYAVPFRAGLNNWPPVGVHPSVIYAIWLWARNTGDWDYACAKWADSKALFNEKRSNARYYADIAGAIGFARLGRDLAQRNCPGASIDDYYAGYEAATAALGNGAGTGGFAAFNNRAEGDYLDPREIKTGFALPAFFGMIPELGLYLREQTGGAAEAHIIARQTGLGVQWWYLTRAGAHAEEGETAYLSPWTAWSHFLARAYVSGDSQSTLRTYLDRPWATGDLYSLQKLVATLQAKP